MATKTQQLIRYENGRYRDRRTPTVDPIHAPRSPGLPTVPVNWFPKQSQALGFAQKLLGVAPVVQSLLKTEAGDQYKEARARAMRGDYTIDDSGLITFTAEQQRALSEVEGALDADTASSALRVRAREWQQELAENDSLTPAERVALFTRKVRESSYGTLSNTRDSDYLIAKGSRVHQTASALISDYTSQTIEAELRHEQSMTGQVLSNRLAEMPSGLTLEEETAFRTQALMDFYRNWTRVTGQSIRSEGAKAQIKPKLMDLVASGDVEALERIKDMKFPDGSTLEGMGLITKPVLEAAVEQADRLENQEDKRRQRVWKDNQQLYGDLAVGFYNQALQLPGLNPEEKSERISEILTGIDGVIAELSSLPEDALAYRGRQEILEQLHQYRMLAVQGGPQETLPESVRQTLAELLNADYDAALPALREYANYRMPPELKKPMEVALSWNDSAKRQERERLLWMNGVMAEVKPTRPEYEYDSFNTPIREKKWEKTQEYANAVSLLSSTYDRVTREHPEWSLEERRAEAERVLFSRYAKEDVETRAERVDAKELLLRAETLDPKWDPEGLLQISSGFSSLNPANQRALIGGFLRNPKLDSEQKATLEALAGAPDAELARSQLITTEESIRRMEQMDPRNPRSFFGEHGNHLYKPITTLESHRILIQEKGEDGSIRLVEKEPKDVSSFDRPVTGLYPRDARIIRGTEIVPINALSTEDDLSLLDREPTGVHPDPSVPLYNPGAYPDQEVVRPTRDGALFYSNLTNRNKPLDDHMIITAGPGGVAIPMPGMPRRNGNVVMMKRYGDCTEEMRKNAVTPPFDPDYRVLVKIRGKYRVIPLGDYLNYPHVRFVSSKPVDLMSSQEQIQLLLEE